MTTSTEITTLMLSSYEDVKIDKAKTKLSSVLERYRYFTQWEGTF